MTIATGGIASGLLLAGAIRSGAIVSAAAGSVPFVPSSLFSGAANGGWWDPSDTTTLWQDTGGLTPVTASGQTVARVDDKSGFGNHLLQATAAARPVYTESGALKYLTFDGVDDLMVSSTGITQPMGYYEATAFDRLSIATALGFISYAFSSSNHFTIAALSSLQRANFALRFSSPVGNFVANTGSNIVPSGKNVLDNYAQPGVNNYAANGNIVNFGVPNTFSSTDNMGAGVFRIGGQTTVAENQNFYGGLIVLGRTISNTDRADLRLWLNAKMGI